MGGAGATAEEWSWFAHHLGLEPHLLPVVPPGAGTIHPRSRLKAEHLGKVPSRLLPDGTVAGFPDWPSHVATPAQVRQWSLGRLYNTGVQGRAVGAVDIDVEDPEQVLGILAMAREALEIQLPVRRRGASWRVLLAMRVSEGVLRRAVHRLPEGGAVELLGAGEQWIAAGTHPSSEPYWWEGGLPDAIPEVPWARVAAFWEALTGEGLQEGATRTAKKAGSRVQVLDAVGQFLVDRGLAKDTADGRVYVDCPWEALHTRESDLTASAWFCAEEGGRAGHYLCKHAHCAQRRDEEFLEAVGFDDRGGDFGPPESFTPEPPGAPEAAAAAPGGPGGPGGPGARRTRFPFRRAMDAVKDRSEAQWLPGLRNILERSVLAVAASQRDTYKSFVTLHWCMTTALAGATVVLLSAEGAGLGRRMDAWLKRHRPQGLQAGESLDRFYVLERAVRLTDAGELAAVVKDVEMLGLKPELICIDTLSKYSAGADENDNTQMRDFMAALSRELRERWQATVLLIAHEGHEGRGRPRGASSLMANNDAEYMFKPLGKESYRAQVTRERFKDSPHLPDLHYRLEKIHLGYLDAAGEEVTSLAAVETQAPGGAEKLKAPTGSNQQVLLLALRKLREESLSRPAWTELELRTIGRAAGLNHKRIGEAIRGLTSSGHLIATSEGVFVLADTA